MSRLKATFRCEVMAFTLWSILFDGGSHFHEILGIFYTIFCSCMTILFGIFCLCPTFFFVDFGPTESGDEIFEESNSSQGTRGKPKIFSLHYFRDSRFHLSTYHVGKYFPHVRWWEKGEREDVWHLKEEKGAGVFWSKHDWSIKAKIMSISVVGTISLNI